MKKPKLILLVLCSVVLFGAKSSLVISAASKPIAPNGSTAPIVQYAYECPENYYSSLNGLTGIPLLEKLAKLTYDNHKTYTTYEDLKGALSISDADPDNPGKIKDFYTGWPIDYKWNYNAAGYTRSTWWEREHLWCQSLSIDNNGNPYLYGEKYAGADVHHLRPEIGSINGGRSNGLYADVQSMSDKEKYYFVNPSSGVEEDTGCYRVGKKYFEPRKSSKGDVARILMYMYTHYSTEISTIPVVEEVTGKMPITSVVYTPSGEAQDAWDLLLKWNELDKVDEFESKRNNYCASVTGTRNPYIDHPEYASMIWGDGSYEGGNDGGEDNNDQPITPDKEDANLDELSSLINKHFNKGYYVNDTKIDLTESSIKELLDLDEGFYNKATYLDLTTYFTPEELWMTNEKGVNSGYGTDENGNMTHFILSDNEEKIIDYIVEKGQFDWVNANENGMEGYYLTLKDLIVTSNQNWKVSNGVYESNDKDVIDLFKAVCAPCYKGFNSDLSNYITFDRVEIEEVNNTLELRLYANEVDAYKVNSGDNLFAKAIITKNTSNELKEVDLTLSFDNESNRVSYSTSQQVWKQNGVNLINDKASSTNSVPNAINPVKFFKNSKVTIYLDNDIEFNKIVFTCNSTSHSNVLYNSIPSTTGVTVSKNSKEVTVTFANNVSEFVISSISAATWVDSIVVTSLQ